ncbi:hypothetical protein BB390_02565 [Helicobacter pylori]|nr:hypothetical protein BB390_02565 [Helicobacter pylori]
MKYPPIPLKKTNFKLRKRISNEKNEFHHHQTKQKASKPKKMIKFSPNDKKKKRFYAIMLQIHSNVL